jgi:hypothetical protein
MAQIEEDQEIDMEGIDDESEYEHASPENKEAIKVQSKKENERRPLFYITWKRASHIRAALGYFERSYGAQVIDVDAKNGITTHSHGNRGEGMVKISLPPTCFDKFDVTKNGPLCVDVRALLSRLTIMDRNKSAMMVRDNASKSSMIITQGDTVMTVALHPLGTRDKLPEVGDLPIFIQCDRTKLIASLKAERHNYGGSAFELTVTKKGNVKVSHGGGRDERAVVDLTRYCDVEWNAGPDNITNKYSASELREVLKKIRSSSVTLRIAAKKSSPIGIISCAFEESVMYVGAQPYGTIENYLPAERSY